MPGPLNLVKAVLQELLPDFSGLKPGGVETTVQFNPDSLKVSYANQLQTPNGAGSQSPKSAKLFVGSRTTKLSLQLWFDATVSDLPPGSDVQQLTTGVLYFMRPKTDAGQEDAPLVPPAVRFSWGTFTFDGVIESVEETMEFFSNDGKPLRSNMSLTFSQQKIETFDAGQGTASAQQIAALLGQPGSPTAGRPVGLTAMTAAQAGVTVQGLADISGNSDWQTVAAANGIENPRLLQPGQLLNMNPVVSASASISI